MGNHKMAKPYTLAISSHKGGFGRTLSAAALAVSLGRNGMTVAILDVTRTKDLQEIAARVEWENVVLMGDEGLGMTPDYVIVDCPHLSEPDAVSVLSYADGALITCPPERSATVTISTAVKALLRAQSENPGLEILGICLTSFREESSRQQGVLEELSELHPGLMLEAVVPADTAFSKWALRPSRPPVDGAAFQAYAKLAEHIETRRQHLLSNPAPSGLEELVAAIAREDAADASERQLVDDINWCELCGGSIPRKFVRNGKARRNAKGQLSCAKCLGQPVGVN